MPIYEYRCQSCGHVFDKLVRSLSGPIEVECPVCQSSDCRKAISRLGASSHSGSAASAGSCAPSGG